MPEETLSLLLEFSESTKGGANGLSGREKVGLSIGAGEGVLEVPKVPKIPKAPKVPKDVAPFIVLILMSKSK